MNNPLIEIRNLSVDYWQQGAWTTVIAGLNLRVGAGETFGLVGESGSGKSTTANALLGYLPRSARYRQGEVWFGGQNLLALPEAALRRIRGGKISFVPQNPTTALSPSMRIGQQIVEVLQVHGYCATPQEARQRTLALLEQVSLPNPAQTFQKYPHQLSGGQQQRVTIAMALACDPQLIVLDEPTTGLDVTTQAQILELLVELRSRYGLAMFYITHNLGVVAQICSRIGVMYAGQVVEVAPTRELFHNPRHPYTQGLIAAAPRLHTPLRQQKALLTGLLRRAELPPGCQFAPRCAFAQPRCFEQPQGLTPVADSALEHQVACHRWLEIPALTERLQGAPSATPQATANGQMAPAQLPLLVVENLQASYRQRWFFQRQPPLIIDNLSFVIYPGETLALVGESGSGKTTVARALSGLTPYVAGKLQFAHGHNLTTPLSKRSPALLRMIQLVFQNPDASLNPRQRVAQIIGRPLEKFFGHVGVTAQTRIAELLGAVQLDKSYAQRFPDELSGGERQRIAIARALAAEPQLLLCDEILSALDVSVQATVLELLTALNAQYGLALLFISHDLAVVRALAHRVGVLYRGALCEVGQTAEVFAPPYHPYTALLLRAVPEADPDQAIVPTSTNGRKNPGLLTQTRQPACPFAGRCPRQIGPICEQTPPPWQTASATHSLRCHIPLTDLLRD